MSNGWKELLDLEDDSQLREAIELLLRFDEVYENFIKKVVQSRSKYSTSVKKIVEKSKQLKEQTDGLNVTLETNRERLKEIAAQSEITALQYGDLKKKISDLDKSILKLRDDQDKLKKSTDETLKLQKEEERLKKRLSGLNKDQAKDIAKVKVKIQERNKELKESAKQSLGLITLYEKESKRLIDLRNSYKKAALEQGESSKEARRLNKEVTALDRKLKRIDKNAGQFQRSVANYPKFLSAISVKFTAVLVAVTGLINGIGRAIKTFRDFQDTNSVLNSILGKTSEETAELREQQLELGKSTEFSASQVAKAQTELARLGVSQENIIKMTPGILSAATALGTDLASAAGLVAGQLNAFQLEASESKKVADILTKTTQISAFNFSKLETALSIVSPAAKAVNVSLERQNAILGVAVDNNIDASVAATALRNIFIDLSDKGLTWEDAMDIINDSTDRLSAANELFGKRGAVVASVIANNTDKINENEKALENAAGTAERFAKEQLDTLTGDIKLLSSAWEGFLLGIEKGDGLIASFIRGTLQSLTKILGEITPDIEKQTSSLELQRQEFNALIGVLIKLNPTEEESRKIINQLNTEYKDYLPALITEKTTKEELAKIQKQVNTEILNTILLRQQEENLQKISENQIKLAQQVIDLQKEQSVLIQKNEKLNDTSSIENLVGKTGDLTEAQKKNAQLLVFRAKQSSDEVKFNEERISLIDGEISRIRALIQGGDGLKNSIKERADQLRIILGLDEKEEKSIGRKIKGFKKIKEIEITPKTIEIKTEGIEQIPVEIKKATDKTDESLKKLQDLQLLRAQNFLSDLSGQVSQWGNQIGQLFSNINERRQQESDLRIDRLEQERERELAIVGENATQREAIEKRFDAEKEKIEEEQIRRSRRVAVFQKALAISQSLIDTAAATIKAVRNAGGLPVGLPFGIATAAFGALRTAAIAAAPIPAFSGGTDNAPGGLAFVGEEGREIVLEPNGRMYLTGDSAELRDIPEGSTILTNAITENILNSRKKGDDSGSILLEKEVRNRKNNQNQQLERVIKSSNDKVKESLLEITKNIEIHNFKFGRNGLGKDIRRGGTIKKEIKEENRF